MVERGRPLRVAILNDYEIVVHGVRSALEPFDAQVEVVETDTNLPVASDVDVILVDTFGQPQGEGLRLADLRRVEAKVVVFSWNVEPRLVEASMAMGADGYLAKSLDAAGIVAGLRRVADGERVRPAPAPATATADVASPVAAWPGQEFDLTAREAEVLALICQGMSNQEIADTIYLSINSVKTYIRTAYRRIDVSTRAQAVIWGLRHGFGPDRSRQVHDIDPE